ncbi:autoinducer 2 ABC transporter substrate-binding protein LsrB [Schaalia sp. JY-X159]|uniref:autoinducer 2 ABC transporter substrate-binding protein LsrB n=1 Tax=Schaalia sp. JY-X159 TaxID=2758575 RepID=UPI00165DD486|nr:autoinducer 2 ABC transporter substrate-binding protein LsrB [Schaalia sp. JY-X159]
MKRIALASFSVLASLAVLAGCSSGGGAETAPESGTAGESGAAEGSGAQVAFIPKLTGVGFFEAGGEGAVAEGERLGLDVKYVGSPEASVAAQTEIINNYLGQGFQSLIVSSTSPDGLCTPLKRAMDDGNVVLTWDSDTNPECRQFYISQGTPQQMGELLVSMVTDQMPADEPAEVAFHYSSPTVTDQNQWTEVAKSVIAEDTSWDIVDTIYSENQTDLAVQQAEALINANPNLKAILCPDANALPGTAKAVENLGKTGEIIVVGFSTPNAMRDYVDSGVVNQFALWDVKMQGALSVFVANELLNGADLKVGDKIDYEGTELEIQNNSVQGYDESTNNEKSGIIVLPERVVFTKDNIANYDF